VQSRLAQATVLRGDFQSTREVAGLKRPLRSSGRFLLAREVGLLWSQDAPFAQEFTITRAFLRQGAPGTPPRTVPAAEHPAAAAMGGILIAIFSGNALPVFQDFTTRFDAVSETQWTLTFTPARPPLTEMFRSIRVAGSQWIDQVELLNPQGDRTLVRFQDVRTTPAELSDAEQAAFRP
jgi:hypothetical protein